MKPGTRITANGWSGTVLGMQKGFVMCQGPITAGDPARGMRAFRPQQVSAIGGAAFVAKSIPQLRKPGCATPRKEAVLALEREDRTRRTWRLAPAY